MNIHTYGQKVIRWYTAATEETQLGTVAILFHFCRINFFITFASSNYSAVLSVSFNKLMHTQELPKSYAQHVFFLAPTRCSCYSNLS
jgi:hypothetical protein